MEPVVQTSGVGAPSIIDIIGILQSYFAYLIKHNGFGRHQRYVVFVNNDVEGCDSDVFIFVKGL